MQELTPETKIDQSSEQTQAASKTRALDWNDFKFKKLPNQEKYTNWVLKALYKDPSNPLEEPTTYYLKLPKGDRQTEPPKIPPILISACLEAAASEIGKSLFARVARSYTVIFNENENVIPVAVASEELPEFRSFHSVLLKAFQAYKEGKMDDPDLQLFTVKNLLAAGFVSLLVMLAITADQDPTADNIGLSLGKFANLDHGQKLYPLYSALFGSDPKTTTQFDLACYGLQLERDRELEQAEKEQLVQQYPPIEIAKSFTPSAEMICNFPFQYNEKGEYQWFSYHWPTDNFRDPNLFDRNDENDESQLAQFLEQLKQLLVDLYADPEFQKQKWKYFLKFILQDETMIRTMLVQGIPEQVQLEHFGEDEMVILKERGFSEKQYFLDIAVQYVVDRKQQFEEVLKNMPEFQQFLTENQEVFQEILEEYAQYNEESPNKSIIDPEKLEENFERIKEEVKSVKKAQQEQSIVAEMASLTEIHNDSSVQKAPPSAAGCKATLFAYKTPHGNKQQLVVNALTPTART